MFTTCVTDFSKSALRSFPDVTVQLALRFGRRPFLFFGLATMLVVVILVTVNVASHYALKRYADDQLARLPWYFALYQTNVRSSAQVRVDLSLTPNIAAAEDVYLLRLTLPPDTVPQVDGKPLGSPFLSLLAATDPALLPPTVRPPSPNQAVLALVGPESRMSSAFQALQGARTFFLDLHGKTSFEIGLARTVRLDRSELNRWFTDRTNTPSFIPDIGVILVIPNNFDVVTGFDDLGGHVQEHGEEEEARDPGHVESGSYFPEVVHLLRMDRPAVISGWDVTGSIERLGQVQKAAQITGSEAGVPPLANSMSGLLLARIQRTAGLLDLLSTLIALPLLWVAWLFLGRLTRLLLLNERRLLGLLRLRGVPGRLIGRAMLLSIGLGSAAGAIVGLVAASVCAVLIYAGEWLPWRVLLDVEKPWLLLGFFLVGLVTALLAGRDLVRFATSASPLETSARVMTAEAEQQLARFTWWPAVAVLVGGLKVLGWALGFSLVSVTGWSELEIPDLVLNFLGLPLFVYGAASLAVLNRSLMQMTLAATPRWLAGGLKPLWLHHLSLKPHRVGGFLLIMALMASVSLYPTVMAGSFGDKAVRGAMVGLGSELGFTLNTPDVVNAELLSGPLAAQQTAISRALTPVRSRMLVQPGVQEVDFMTEYLLSSVYMPGEGYRSLPLYVIDNPTRYLAVAYHEDALGVEQSFDQIIHRLDEGQILVSPALASFWNLHPGSRLLLGSGPAGDPIRAAVAGTIRYLPGRPLQTITDRESYATSQVDYLNFLFDNSAFVLASASNAAIAPLLTAAPRLAALVKLHPGAEVGATQAALLPVLPAAPLESRLLSDEIQKVGNDMFIDLGLENMRIYLVGGLALALAGMGAVAWANYVEDRRTMALLRIRGAQPRHVSQLVITTLLAPALSGLLLGGLVALVAGYGITNMIWSLREIHSVVLWLTTHLKVTAATGLIVLALLGLVAAMTYGFSAWAFRRSARESLSSAG